ncbi:hypothetical protein D6C97_00544, partial [Aureobasidium pullulans]
RCHLRLCHCHPLHHRCSLQDKQPLSHGLRGRSRGRRCCRRLRLWCCRYLRCFPRLLRRPSLSAPTRQIKRRHRTVMIPLLPLKTSLHLLESSKPSLEMTSIICPSVLRQHHDHLHHFLLLRRGVTVCASHTRRHVDSLTERQLGVLPLFIPIIDLLHLGSFHSFIFVLLSTPPPMLISLPNAP